jgi:amidase
MGGFFMFSIEEATILELQTALDKRIISSVSLVLMYLERIAAYDSNGPRLNSICELNPDALFIAEYLDKERTSKGCRGPLHGIPILLKDNINTGDKMHTCAGSVALGDSFAPVDAHLVKQLRDAGAIIMGKTNMSEFAGCMSSSLPVGYGSRGGQVVNPFDAEASPSGSSTGSAVAVTANFCTAAVGTETVGSIFSPCKTHRLVGIKPTVGLISRDGILTISHSQDSAGPIARCVTDAAILLEAMSGTDTKDPATLAGAFLDVEDYVRACKKTDLTGIRIGVSTFFYEKFSPDERYILDQAIDIMQNEGAAVVRNGTISSERVRISTVTKYEFKPGINSYLFKLGHPRIRTLTDIIEYNKAHSVVALKYGQDILEIANDTSGTLTEAEYILDKIADIKFSRTEGLDRVMTEERLDALMFLEDAAIADMAGYPLVTVPGGIADGQPWSITFVGKPYSENLLIKLAYVYEQATQSRIKPLF